MASGTASRLPASSDSASTLKLDQQQAILSELRRTGRQVKLTDLAGQLLLSGIALISVLLLLAIIDHWVMPLGFWGRLVSATAIVVAVVWFVIVRLAPLLLHRIHPSYAARTIENSTPALKNSLINFLLLREQPGVVREVVLEAVQSRAAADIKSVPIETVVDRTRVIRLGYVLCGVMAALAIYKIASPKDPFQTFARVALPFAEIARPSRVTIAEVTPGSSDVFHGEQVKIAARIRGIRASETVIVRYSSRDGSIVDRDVVMQSIAGDLFFEARIPEVASNSADTGITQDLQYMILAGDAETPLYELRVKSAPTIVVSKVEYQYPAYTKLPSRVVELQGDLQAIEGTVATIHGSTSHPLQSAIIDLDYNEKTRLAAQSLSMTIAGETSASYPLKMSVAPGSGESRPSNYQLRFTSSNQLASQNPIVHRVEVIRDLAPEVQLLQPKLPLVEIPLDGSLTMEVRAVDPDFALRSVHLTGTREQDEIVRHPILEETLSGPPQTTANYKFVPAQHKLAVGDEITFVAIAVDNKTDSVSGIPAGNKTVSPSVVVRIVDSVGRENGSGGASDNRNADPTMDDAPKPENAVDPAQKNGDGNTDPTQQQPGSENTAKPPMPGNSGSQKPKSNPADGGNSSSPMSNQPMPSGPPSGDPMESGSKQPDGASGEPKKPGENDTSKSPPGEKPMDDSSSKPMEGSEGDSGMPMPGSGDMGKPMEGSSSETGKPQEGAGQPMEGGESGGAPQQGTSAAGSPPPGSGDSGDPKSNSPTESGPMNGDPSSGGQGDQGQSSSNPASGQPQQSTTDSSQGGTPGGDASGEASGTSNDAGTQGSGRPSNSGPQRAGDGPGSGKPHDGEVIDEVLNYLKEKQKQNPSPASQDNTDNSTKNTETNQVTTPKNSASGASDPSAAPQPGSPPPGSPEQGTGAQPQESNAKPSDAGSPSAGTPPTGTPKPSDPKQPAGNEATGGPSPATGDKPQPSGTKPKDPQGASGTPSQGDTTAEKPENSPGGDSRGASKTKPEEQTPEGSESSKPSSPGQGTTGEAGDGNASQQDKGSGAPQEQNRDRPKDQTGGPKNSSSSEASAPSGSKKQSNSKGGDSGDRSGGGSSGAGQSNGQAGNDSAGSNSSADTGAGKSSEQGNGESGEQGGEGTEQSASAEGGKPAGEKGSGNSSRASTSGDKQGAGAPPKSNPEQGNSDANEGAPASNNQGAGSKTGPVVGGGKEGDRGAGTYDKSGPATEGDAVNLDYARRATDMALEHLRDQQHDPDPELLKRLRMTRDEMNEFLRRWESLEKEARENPAKARELDESLRSLGITPPSSRTRAGGSTSDNTRDLRDSGDRTAPPSRYRDLFDAFRKGAARSSN